MLELAIAIPILIALLALIFDAGFGFSAARDSAVAVRAAARVAALSGDNRLADYYALEAIRSEYVGARVDDASELNDAVRWVVIYRSIAGGTGEVPSQCAPGGRSVRGLCNVYDIDDLRSLSESNFASATCAGEIDAAWCPTSRAADSGDYLGVGIWVDHKAMIGLTNIGPDGGKFELVEHAVFAIYIEDDL